MATALTALCAALAALLVLPVGAAPLDVPFEYTGDANSHYMMVRSVLEGGWYYEIPRLGAPDGAELYDYPSADTAFLVLFRLLGAVTGGDAALVLNLVYLLGFPCVAVAMQVALRGMRVSTVNQVAFGVVFAFLPYHLIRGQSHLFLSAFVAVPLVSLVLYRQLAERPAFLRSPDGGWTLRDGRTWAALAACVLVAGTGVYYAVFAVVLLAAVGLVRLGVDRDPRHLASSAALALVTTALVVASLMPTILYQRAMGPNPEGGRRLYSEAERSGLKPLRLLLPIPEHRVAALGAAARVELEGAVRSEAGANLGLVGSVGLLAVLGAASAAATGGRPDADVRPAGLGVLAAVAVLLSSTAGVGYLVTALGFTQVRAWNRMSVFVGYFALAGAAVLLDRALGGRPTRLHVAATVGALVAVLGVWDQTPGADPGRRERAAAAWTSDRAFVETVEQTLGAGAAVFQLPFVPFPEGPLTGAMHDYDLLKGYLHSDGLRWSYGGMKGRQSPWYAETAALPVPRMLAGAVAEGFDGLWIDRRGYRDPGAGPGPDTAPAVELEVRGVLGARPLVSRDGRLVFFDLRPLRAAASGDEEPVAPATEAP